MAAQTKQKGLEPRFSLPDATPRSSKTTIVVSGIRTYIYGLEELSQVSSAGERTNAAILLLAHNRTRTYKVTEGIAHELLWRYREGITGDGNAVEGGAEGLPLLAVTFDMRNHGEREISKDSNLTWKDGNENHAGDLLSLIDGSAQDLQLLLTYLPAYLPQVNVVANLVFGVSLGAHTAWRLAVMPNTPAIRGMALVVGCPDLTGLLLARLDVSVAGRSRHKLRALPYELLEECMDPVQRRRWPRALHDVVSGVDRTIEAEFPREMHMLLLNGDVDPLVPKEFTSAWVEHRQKEDRPGLEYWAQENTGHSCTKEMVWAIADWLRKELSKQET